MVDHGVNMNIFEPKNIIAHVLLLALGAVNLTYGQGVGGVDTDVKHGADFYPPPGKVLHIAGQTREAFADYLETVTESGVRCGLPAGVSFYSSLYRTGFNTPHANVPGDDHQDLTRVLKHYEVLIPQISVWADEQELNRVNSGQQDENIRLFARQLSSYKRPIYLRIAGEFDDGRYKDPEAYRQAYRHIVDLFVELGVRNVSYVWHSIGMKPTYQNRDPLDWYPGDAYVNWIGISVFQIGKEGYYPDHNRGRIVEIAREKGLPLMIVESSAIRQAPRQRQLSGKDYWDYWYRPYFEFIENNPEVRGLSIINTDWDSQQQFERYGWGDCRLQADPVVLKNWRGKMRDSRYLHSHKGLYQLLGFRPYP